MRLISTSSKLFVLALACFSLAIGGCLSQDLQEIVDKAKAEESGESTPASTDPTDDSAKRDGLNADEQETKKPDAALAKVAGKWEMDISATIKATKAAVKSPLLDMNQYVNSLKKSVMDFDFKDDGTFKCHQILPGFDEHYSGTWTLDGDEMEINQTHRGKMLEADQLTGTVNEDGTLHLIHVQQGLQIPYRMKRAK